MTPERTPSTTKSFKNSKQPTSPHSADLSFFLQDHGSGNLEIHVPLDEEEIQKNRMSGTSSSSSSNTRALAWGFLCGAAVTTTFSIMLWTRDQRQRRNNLDDHHDDMTRDLALLEKQEEEQNAAQEITTAATLMDDVNLDLRLIRKAEGVLQLRTSRLIVVVERCVNDHNYSAILRTTEALGIQHVWMIDPPENNCNSESSPFSIPPQADDETTTITAAAAAAAQQQRQHFMDMQGKAIAGGLSVQEIEDRNRHRLFAQGATEWLTLRNFATTRECIQALRDENYKIYVTDLSQHAVPLTRRALEQANAWPILGGGGGGHPRPTIQHSLAICFGTEAVGCTQELLQAADLRVYLPLRGFADSLNLSVATALVLHHLCNVLEPRFFGRDSMSNEERVMLRRAWYTKLAQQRLLTSRDKKRRKKLMNDIQKCELLQAKLSREGPSSLTPEQHEKVSKLPQMRLEVQEIEASAQFHCDDNNDNNNMDTRNESSSDSHNGTTAASPPPPHYQQVLEEWIANPPRPLSDLRRVDSHRISYVGKGTKKRSEEYWKDMAAVNPNKLASEHGSSAKYFRNVLNAT